MCHSFIIGDLVIDHTIFVKETTADHQPKGNEKIYEVLRRTDTAGGAANCARILAALSDGETYLWGITGKSNWGDFRSILSHAQAVDGSAKAIKFRGITDETDGQMNTISRLIAEASGTHGGPLFQDRFDEYRHLHVTPEKRKSVLHYLERARYKLEDHSKGNLDVIIINDLDYGCLTTESVADISEYAQQYHVPLFVDPKYNGDKYRRIKGKAIMPNLREWCCLVGQRQDEMEWRKRIRQSRDLSDIAYLSFLTFGDFDYYIITCDEDGILFIGPSTRSGEQDRYMICNIPAHAPSPHGKVDQLGSGDVLTAVFAMELDRISRSGPANHDTEQALTALIRASVVVACYRQMPWHHMPNREVVKEALVRAYQDEKYGRSSPIYVGTKESPRIGMKYLPKDEQIVLSEYNTIVPGWFSDHDLFCEKVQVLLDACLSKHWGKHIVLGAPTGCGKTRFYMYLRGLAEKAGIEFTLASTKEDIESVMSGLAKRGRTQGAHSIVVVDEALKHGFQALNFALDTIDKCGEHGVRLLLIDTGFFNDSPLDDPANAEFERRVEQHFLVPPNKRPGDIPLIIAGIILEHSPVVEIRGDFLLAFTCALLHKPSVGKWRPEIEKAVLSSEASRKSGGPLRLTGADIPAAVRETYLDHRAPEIAAKKVFTFSRGAEWPLLPTIVPEATGDAA
jgi:bifunctional ADP-heptose synthase (sugar kinase/adenylyltransferase)